LLLPHPLFTLSLHDALPIYGDHVLGFQLLRLRLRPVTFQAKRVGRLGAQQMLVVSTVRLMTGGASLLKRRLMQMRLLELLSLVGDRKSTRLNSSHDQISYAV